MIVDDSTTSNSADSYTQLETRFSIAKNAIENSQDNGEHALRQFLQVLGNRLTDFRIDRPDATLLDVRVLAALADMKLCRDHFVEILRVICELDKPGPFLDMLQQFIGQTIALKRAPRDIIHFNHLWCDHYRFFVRELFLYTIAYLIRQQRFEEAAAFIRAEYSYPTPTGTATCDYREFDAYIKCLDEFRARRIGKKRLSLSADELRNRADLPFVNFDDIMQADFILCIYGLLHRPQALTHWFPRTVVYAEPYEQRGFDLFFRAQSKSFFATIALLLEVRDKTELLDLFETARRQCRLDQWKIGAAPIPFASYMGLSALATT